MGWNKNRIAVAALCVFGLGVCCESAAGGTGPPQPQPITITVDESCHGTLSITGGTATSLLCGLGQDPLPFGLPGAMIYSLPGTGVIPGTLILLEPGGGTSDVIRFFGGAALGPLEAAAGAFLVFYSDNSGGADALADIGFPSATPGNSITLLEVGPEGNNGFTYIPGPGDPGSIVGGPPTSVTYVIISDSVPEPATVALLGIGLAGLGLWRRARKQ